MIDAVVAVSANAEWRVVRAYFREHSLEIEFTPYGECFALMLGQRRVVVLHGGWGKIAAAASTQYALARWSPRLLINFGTCGGFDGQVERGALLLVDRTLVYDIIEQMGDPQAAVDHYTVGLDLSWLREPLPLPVRRGLLVSADRDICVPDIPMLIERFGAAAADWESGAIAWVAKRNNTRCLILRGVSDLVGVDGGEADGGSAYADANVFRDGARMVMEPLLRTLPEWLACAFAE